MKREKKLEFSKKWSIQLKKSWEIYNNKWSVLFLFQSQWRNSEKGKAWRSLGLINWKTRQHPNIRELAKQDDRTCGRRSWMEFQNIKNKRADNKVTNYLNLRIWIKNNNEYALNSVYIVWSNTDFQVFLHLTFCSNSMLNML